QGKYAEAARLFQKALAVWRETLGEDHPETARGYSNVAFALHAQGRYAEAEAAWRRATRRFEAARLAVGATGLERAAFNVERSPWPMQAACLARNGKSDEAWGSLEQHLARGLLDDLAARVHPERRPEQRRRWEDLQDRLRYTDQQLAAHLA